MNERAPSKQRRNQEGEEGHTAEVAAHHFTPISPALLLLPLVIFLSEG